jgi:hypothetical protein
MNSFATVAAATKAALRWLGAKERAFIYWDQASGEEASSLTWPLRSRSARGPRRCLPCRAPHTLPRQRCPRWLRRVRILALLFLHKERSILISHLHLSPPPPLPCCCRDLPAHPLRPRRPRLGPAARAVRPRARRPGARARGLCAHHRAAPHLPLRPSHRGPAARLGRALPAGGRAAGGGAVGGLQGGPRLWLRAAPVSRVWRARQGPARRRRRGGGGERSGGHSGGDSERSGGERGCRSRGARRGRSCGG